MRNLSRSSIAATLLLLSLAGAAGGASAEIKIGADRRIRITDDWRFFKGEAPGAEQATFSDAAWRALDPPPDWAIEGPFDRKISPHDGSLPFFGVAWYRKHFTVPASAKGKYFSVQFDGAMSNSTVWINGQKVGGRPYGYESFALDLTPYMKFGEENVLAVRLAPEDQSSRWYPGAGIYRHVWLNVTGAVRVAQWGSYITTPSVSDAKATVAIRTEVENKGTAEARVRLETAILDAAGKQAGRASSEVTIPAGGKQSVEATVDVANPHRWDLDTPYLYSAASTIRQGALQTDRYVTEFGIRTIEYSREKGFLLNGHQHRFNGVCMHHDLGALGTAFNRRAMERQLEIMKSMGVNAIRTSHNPPAPELLELTD